MIKIKRGKSVDTLLKNSKAMNKEWVQVGHWTEQGVHYSGMTYVELLEYWAAGDGGVVQDVRSQFIFDQINNKDLERNSKLIDALTQWVRQTTSRNPNNALIESLGQTIREEYVNTFNDRQSPYMNGTETPLFETGDLANATGYKTSVNKTIKEG